MRRLNLATTILAFALTTGGCETADVPLGPAEGTTGGTIVPEFDPPEPIGCDTPTAGPSPLRRLSRTEYDNTMRDLLGDDSRYAETSFPPDGTVMGFPIPVPMTSTIAELYRGAAESAAARVLNRAPGILQCEGDEAECAQQIIDVFGPRAYRRPLTEAQGTAIFGVYAASRESGDGYTAAVRQLITAVLQSPHFLYRLEFGSPDPVPGTVDIVALDGYEMANRLSYLVWNSMPDQALFDAAAAGQLATEEQIEAQARRMLADDKARAGLTRFFMQWFEVETILDALKDDELYPDFDEEIRLSMLAETKAFIEHVIWEDDATLDTLLDAPYTFVNARLADFYGFPDVRGDAFVKIDVDGVRPNGILGQGSLLASHATPSTSSPVLRGMFVRSRLFCQDIPPPPPDLEVVPPNPTPGLTTRELYEDQHSTDPSCSGCHQLMDPIGFAFEHFDAVGLFRETEVDQPIDASGTLTATDVDRAFDGLEGLVEALDESDQVRSCVADQWFRYAFGRRETADDTCSTQLMVDALAASNNDLRELVIAMTRSDAFRYRRAIDGPGGE